MNKRNQSGFTLYELLITTLVVGTILTIGVPSMGQFSQNNRIATVSNDLLSSFQMARSEAARSKSMITICASNNSTDPVAADCTGGTFDDGWIIFIDLNGDLARVGFGENLLRSFPPIPDTVDITDVGGGSYFAFAATGLGRGIVAGQPPLTVASICDHRGNVVASGVDRSAARALVATPLGRATVLRTVTQINNQGGCP